MKIRSEKITRIGTRNSWNGAEIGTGIGLEYTGMGLELIPLRPLPPSHTSHSLFSIFRHVQDRRKFSHLVKIFPSSDVFSHFQRVCYAGEYATCPLHLGN